jgi:hypothetical protein
LAKALISFFRCVTPADESWDLHFSDPTVVRVPRRALPALLVRIGEMVLPREQLLRGFDAPTSPAFSQAIAAPNPANAGSISMMPPG